MTTAVLLVLVLAGVVQADWFECPYIDWWDPPAGSNCPQAESPAEETAVEPLPPETPEPGGLTPEAHALVAGAIAAERARRAAEEELKGQAQMVQAAAPEQDWKAYPLFPQDRLAGDAPALFAELLENPTLEKAEAYWLWYEERQARLIEVQRLIAAAGRRVAESRGLPVGEYEAYFLEEHGEPSLPADVLEKDEGDGSREVGRTLRSRSVGPLPVRR